MEKFTLTAQLRDEKGTSAARKFRREGFTPGVVYGRGKPVSNIIVSTKDLGLLLRRHGASHAIDLTIEGQVKDSDAAVLVKELQRDPITREIESVDLQWVSLTEAVHLAVPVQLVGEAPGAKIGGGALEQIMFEIQIACLPNDIPEAILVDISGLELGGTIHVSDLTPPASVTFLADDTEGVVTIAKPITAEDLETRLEVEEGAEPAAGEAESES